MFEYYSGNCSGNNTFIGLPKFLFSSAEFSALTTESKLLYGLMLDRASLSLKNGWTDEENRVYIIYTLDEAMKNINCRHGKCSQIFAELENVGLIERRKRGQGHPAVIYVKVYRPDMLKNVENDDVLKEVENVETLKSVENNAVQNREDMLKNVENLSPEVAYSKDFSKSEVCTAEKQQSAIPIFGSQDFSKSALNNTDNNNTEKSYTEVSPSCLSAPQKFFKAPQRKKDRTDMTDRNTAREDIKEKIDYDILKDVYSDEDIADEITELITDVITGFRNVFVNGRKIPPQTASEIFGRLRYDHISSVIEKFSHFKGEISRPDLYICAALYNSVCSHNIADVFGLY